jgi:hypothetical protein
LPAALMGVLLKYESDASTQGAWRRPVLVFAASGVTAVILLAVAFVTLSPRTELPLHASITDMRDPEALGRVSELDVDVSNDGAVTVTPTFGIVHTGHQTPVHWTIAEGPAELAAGSSAHYKLTAPMPTATIPYDGAMHLRVYDRGSERRTSVVLQRVHHETPPPIGNPTFQEWGLNAENGLRQPLLWTARHTHDASGESLEQIIKQPITELSINAALGPLGTSGFELRGARHCVRGVFSEQPVFSVEEREVNHRQCKVIAVPATANRPLQLTLDLRQLVGAEFLTHFFRAKNDTRLVIFGATTHFNDVRAR